MATSLQRPEEQGRVLSLNEAIDNLDLIRDGASVGPIKNAFDSTKGLLATIRDSMMNEVDCVELGFAYAEVCGALHRGTDGKQLNQLSQPVLAAIERFTKTAAETQRNIVKRGKRSVVSRALHAKSDKKVTAAWRQDLDGILRVFNSELGTKAQEVVPSIRPEATDSPTVASDRTDLFVTHADAPSDPHDATETPIAANRGKTGGQGLAAFASAPGDSPPPSPKNTQRAAPHVVRTYAAVSEVKRDVAEIRTMVSGLQRDMQETQGGNSGQRQLVENSMSGETPPPPPRIFFGRDELIERIIGFAEDHTPIALTGAGGIGKTSIALEVLHHNRMEERFGVNRRFIRCDQFPASLIHFLRRLSKVIGAGVENPRDLTPLRPILSSRDMLIILDNAEVILDPEGTDAREIYDVVDELSCFKNIFLCITSRISTVPPGCETLEIPTLSMEAGCDTFYRIYKCGEKSDLVRDILRQLDFHPLSITLLATVAHHNKWGTDRLVREWEKRRTSVLETSHKASLAATIELSLGSPFFRELGPDARELLGVIAFYPQGIDGNNLNWLFPTLVNATDIFDKLCILSLTYQNDGFITMLAPLRDYLRPGNPLLSPLLCTTRDLYFGKLAVPLDPSWPGFEEARWIASEDVNVEHLLDVLTAIDPGVENVWSTCADFMRHLYWHKPRLSVLGRKIEALPDDHPYKPHCLGRLAGVFDLLGNLTESKRLYTHALGLWRERGNLNRIIFTLRGLSGANRKLQLYEEAVEQAREALEISEQAGDSTTHKHCLLELAWLLCQGGQLDAAEEVASRVGALLPEAGDQWFTCKHHRLLSQIYQRKGEEGKAIDHLKAVLEISSSFGYHDDLFWSHFYLAILLFKKRKIDDAHAHITQAKLQSRDYPLDRGHATLMNAALFHNQLRLGEARSEALQAADIYEKLGDTEDLERCRERLRRIDEDEEWLSSLDAEARAHFLEWLSKDMGGVLPMDFDVEQPE